MAKYNKDHVLTMLKQFYEEGQDALQDGSTDRTRAWKMWNREFSNTNLPRGTIYYPKARAYGGYIQRSIVKTFTQAPELMEVAPATGPSSNKSAQIAEATHRLMNAIQQEQENELEKFYDDTSVHAVVVGDMIGKIEWERIVKKTTVTRIEQILDDTTGMPMGEVEIEEEVEEVLVNRSRKRYLRREDFMWDTNARTWPDARWAMELDCVFTAGTLYNAVESRGYDESVVKDIIKRGRTGETTQQDDTSYNQDPKRPKAKPNEPLHVNIFFGYITLSEFENPTFCRIEVPNDFSDILMLKSEHDDDAMEYIYFWPGKAKRPMIPYVVGYIEPKQGHVSGDSLMIMSRPLQMEENNIRNAIRKDAEQSLNTFWLFRKGSGIDPSQIKNRGQGGYAWTSSDDVRKAATQFPHQSRAAVGFQDLAFSDKDWQMIFGATSYNMGISDPSNADTAMGIAQMQNAANQIVYAKIDRYSTTFLEPLLRMEAALLPQFMSDEDMAEYGVNLQEFGITREDMMRDSKITIDTSYGATNSMARRQMATTMYFGMQQRIKYILSLGAKLPPKDLWGPVEMFDKIMAMSGERGVRRYSSSLPEIIQYNKAVDDRQKQDAAIAEQQQQQLNQRMMEDANLAGMNAAMAQIGPSQQEQAQ